MLLGNPKNNKIEVAHVLTDVFQCMYFIPHKTFSVILYVFVDLSLYNTCSVFFTETCVESSDHRWRGDCLRANSAHMQQY